jgi:hypothetical protein
VRKSVLLLIMHVDVCVCVDADVRICGMHEPGSRGDYASLQANCVCIYVQS